MKSKRLQPGALALVGSGEYLPQMREIDRLLLATLGAAKPRVALIPTASGLELGMPERWNMMGLEHFRELGAEAVPVPLIGRNDADDPQIVAALRDADLYYFSGGNPEYVVETLRGTAAWDAIHAGYRGGAVLAGCSAGAMMLGGHTLSVRSVMRGLPPQWPQALGIVPQLVVMPHFDRVADFAGEDVFRAILQSTPAGATLIGVDEDTALVWHAAAGGAAWQVMGRQSVAVFDATGRRSIFHAGDSIPLPAPAGVA
jgi:cyanophycinase